VAFTPQTGGALTRAPWHARPRPSLAPAQATGTTTTAGAGPIVLEAAGSAHTMTALPFAVDEIVRQVLRIAALQT